MKIAKLYFFLSLLVTIASSTRCFSQKNAMDLWNFYCEDSPSDIEEVFKDFAVYFQEGKKERISATGTYRMDCIKVKIAKQEPRSYQHHKFGTYYSRRMQSIDVYQFAEGYVDVYETLGGAKIKGIKNGGVTVYDFPRRQNDYYVYLRIGYSDSQEVQSIIHNRNFIRNHAFSGSYLKSQSDRKGLKPDVDFFNGFKFNPSQKGAWKKINIESTNEAVFIYDPFLNTDYKLKPSTFNDDVSVRNGLLHGLCKIDYQHKKTYKSFMLVGDFEYGKLVGGACMKKAINYESHGNGSQTVTYMPDHYISATSNGELTSNSLPSIIECIGSAYINNQIKDPIVSSIIAESLGSVISNRNFSTKKVKENYLKKQIISELKRSGKHQAAKAIQSSSLANCLLKGLF